MNLHEISRQTCYVSAMKKKKSPPPVPKEFVIKPFDALKGLKAVTTEPPVAKPPPPPSTPNIEPDDMGLFFQAMANVVQLDAKQQQAAQEKPVHPAKAIIRKIEEDELQLFHEAINGMKLDVRFDDELPASPAPAQSLRNSLLRKLRRGSIRLDYELDLHGLTRDEALEALTMFIGGAFRRKQQAVLIITGRGNHSPEEPVLKKAVEKWLRETGKEMVADFLRAPPQLGGDGAIVVFLKQPPSEG